MVTDNGESIFRYFKYEYLHKNLTIFKIAFMHVYWNQDKSFNYKNGNKKILLDWILKYVNIRHLMYLCNICRKFEAEQRKTMLLAFLKF
jgi:hypothetical protein